MFTKVFIAFLSGLLSSSVNAQQQTTNQALQECMNKVTAQSAVAGALVGGLLGAMLGKDGKGAAIGAGLGAAAGGVAGWQTSWKSCTERLNVVTTRNAQTKNYQETADKYGYNGQGVLFKLEGLGISDQVKAGTDMSSSFRVAVLTPDPTATPQVQVSRAWKCGNTEFNVKPEVFSVQPGTVEQYGRVAIPSADASIGPQQCEMLISLQSEGQVQQAKKPFVILPN